MEEYPVTAHSARTAEACRDFGKRECHPSISNARTGRWGEKRVCVFPSKKLQLSGGRGVLPIDENKTTPPSPILHHRTELATYGRCPVRHQFQRAEHTGWPGLCRQSQCRRRPSQGGPNGLGPSGHGPQHGPKQGQAGGGKGGKKPQGGGGSQGTRGVQGGGPQGGGGSHGSGGARPAASPTVTPTAS